MKYNLLGAVSTIALGAAFGLGSAGPASATPFTQTDPWSFSPNFSGSQVLTFSGFNSTLGHLTSVSISWNIFGSKIGAEAALVGSSATPSPGPQSVSSLEATGTLRLTDNGLPSSFVNFSRTLGPTPGFTGTISSNISQVFGTSTIGSTLGGTKALTGAASYVNAFAFSLTLSENNAESGNNITANVLTGATGTGSGNVVLTYNYTVPPPPPSPTPEPASMALLGAGLAGLGAVRRRRKA